MFILKKKPILVLFVLLSIFLGAIAFPIGIASTTLFNTLNKSTRINAVKSNSGNSIHTQETQSTSRTGVFEPIKNYTREELRTMVDESEPIRYYVSTKVAVSPSAVERGEIDTSKLDAEYTLVSANRTMIEYNITDYFLEHGGNVDTTSTMELSSNDAFVTSSGSENLVIDASAPSYWDRDATILVTITVMNFGWYPYTYAGYAKAYVMDIYSGVWYTEASGSRYVTFTLAPMQSIQITVLVDTESTTSVGLKKIKAGLNFVTYELLDDAGYNFVQRFSRYEYQLYPPTTVSTQEDVFELADLYHFNNVTIIKKAGESVDSTNYYIDTFYEAAVQVLHWVHNHFIYDNSSVVLTNGYGKEFIYSEILASDTYILDHTVLNGPYRGDCTEYTTLFLSFVRALNIPARRMTITLWTVPSHSKWIGHAFAEVLVNKPYGTGFFWMHADPTWNKYNNPSVYKTNSNYYGVGGVKVWQGADDTKNFEDDVVKEGDHIVYIYDHELLHDGIWYDATINGADITFAFVYTGNNSYL